MRTIGTFDITDPFGKLFGFVLTHACRYIVNMLTEAFSMGNKHNENNMNWGHHIYDHKI
jgi:hypothetical protein